jgi:hypothetical protein
MQVFRTSATADGELREKHVIFRVLECEGLGLKNRICVVLMFGPLSEERKILFPSIEVFSVRIDLFSCRAITRRKK